jgi:hypothetical protein
MYIAANSNKLLKNEVLFSLKATLLHLVPRHGNLQSQPRCQPWYQPHVNHGCRFILRSSPIAHAQYISRRTSLDTPALGAWREQHLNWTVAYTRRFSRSVVFIRYWNSDSHNAQTVVICTLRCSPCALLIRRCQSWFTAKLLCRDLHGHLQRYCAFQTVFMWYVNWNSERNI